MKKLITTLFCFLLTANCWLYGQDFWSIVQSEPNFNKSYLIDSAVFQDSLLIVTSVVNTVSCEYNYIFAYNSEGELQWSHSGPYGLLVCDSNYIYSTAYDYGDDDTFGDENTFISKFNAKGERLHHVAYPKDYPFPLEDNYYHEFYPVGIALSPNGYIISFSNNGFISNKETSGEDNILLASPNSITSQLNDYLYLGKSSKNLMVAHGTYYLYNDGATSSLSFDKSILATFFHKDTIYTLLPNRLMRLDTSLNVLDTLVLNTDSDFNNMEFFDGYFWIEKSENDKTTLLKIHRTQGVVDVLTFDQWLEPCQKFGVFQNNYAFLGRSKSEQVAIHTYKNSPQDLSASDFPNIRMTNLEYINLEPYEPNNGFGGSRVSFNALFTIQNDGRDTINSLVVYALLHGGMNCAQHYYYEQFTDIQIPPGQKLILESKRMTDYGNLCFECLAPNGEIEVNMTKNRICEELIWTNIRTLDPPANIRIYPNPSSEYLWLESPEIRQNAEIKLVNIQGKVVYQKTVHAAPLQKIDISDLSTGIYLLRLKNEDGFTFTQKIVID